VPHTYVGFLAIIDQFLFAVLLLLHRPHLRLTQKQGHIRLTENGVQLNIKKTNLPKNLKGIPTTTVYLDVDSYD
jgi:sulfur transfer complex TusBCD TusB component (DsrH family)